MRKKTKTIGWNKIFNVLTSDEEFRQLKPTRKIFVVLETTSIFKDRAIKHSTLTLPIKKVQSLAKPKICQRLPPHYIRFSHKMRQQKLINAQKYEITQLDKKLIEYHGPSFTKSGNSVFTSELLQKVIIFLEQYAQTYKSEEPSRKSILQLIKAETKVNNREMLQQLQKLIYSYWILNRKEYSFPLYRPCWKSYDNVPKHLKIFQKYPNKKKSGTMSQQEQNIIEFVENQLFKAQELCQKVLQRQELKINKISQSIKYFVKQVKGKIDIDIDQYDFPLVVLDDFNQNKEDEEQFLEPIKGIHLFSEEQTQSFPGIPDESPQIVDLTSKSFANLIIPNVQTLQKLKNTQQIEKSLTRNTQITDNKNKKSFIKNKRANNMLFVPLSVKIK